MHRTPQQTLERSRPRFPMPADVRHALIGRAVLGAYKARPAYQQNDYLGWIGRAHQETMRAERIEQMVAELQQGDRYMKMPWRARQSGQQTA